VLEVGADGEDLARLHVAADVHGEAGVGLEAFVGRRHEAQRY
jgi:hypothetical protein